ncbi:hypothetical protein PoB_003444600 [Plakobranchus ocellatus]|uniref:FZ domain-containing protein n=1 Tax=Plakobranchus ocellatus TaxID=259542 RepID=A0AAV4AHY5_9GAST|nr:hypothetical protein PoB_003444600 [Plakobranchus ocellatus]
MGEAKLFQLLSTRIQVVLVLSFITPGCSGGTTTHASTYPFSETTSISTTRAVITLNPHSYKRTTASKVDTNLGGGSSMSSTGAADVRPDSEIRFGNFFYVIFPDDLSSQFLSCLCDPESVRCLVAYKFRENQTSTDFPFLYQVMSAGQEKFPDNDSTGYTHHFVCDVLNFIPGQDISCYRQRVTDHVCESTAKCQSYSLNLTDFNCHSSCLEMSWLSAFTVPIEYTDFIVDLRVVPNGTCSEYDTPGFNVDTMDDEDNNRGRTGFVPLAAGLASAGAIFVLVTVLTWVFCKKIRLRENGQTESVESSASNSSGVYKPWSSTGSQTISTDSQTGNCVVPVHEEDEDQYAHIDDVSDFGGSHADQADCDDEGYNIIREQFDPARASKGPNRKTVRPLPPPPTSNTSLSTQSEDRAIFGENGTLVSLESSIASPFPIGQPNPAPHKPIPLSNKYEHLGIVNIRTSHPAVSDHTVVRNPTLSGYSQLRLVKIPSGEMRLFPLQDDHPLFNDLYSGLQLIGLRNGSLCVIGLLDKDRDEDYHKYFELVKIPKDPSHHEKETNGENSVYPRKEDALTEQEEKREENLTDSLPSIYAIYFGLLDLDENCSFVSTENGGYLRVLDVDSPSRASDGSDYLRVLDVDESAFSPTIGGYLTVLDVDAPDPDS